MGAPGTKDATYTTVCPLTQVVLLYPATDQVAFSNPVMQIQKEF